MEARDAAPVSAIVTAYKRVERTLQTLARLDECVPPPAEILVHVDGNQVACEEAIRNGFPRVRVIVSTDNIGPGGGRNRLVAAAAHAWVASFDDDSFPIDGDYFARVVEILRDRPDASVLAAAITEKGDTAQEARREIGAAVHFGGGGAVYARDHFLATGGYVPLPVAYGMEEVDLCIRLIAHGRRIYYCPWLRVFHDNDHSHHAHASVTAGSIQNLALLAYLRYPLRYAPYALLQVARRIAWLLRVGRIAGLARGIAGIPQHLWRHRALRSPVDPRVLAHFLEARRRPPRLEPLSGC